MSQHLIRIVTHRFVAGAVWENGRCVAAAPILKWMVGKRAQQVRAYLERNNWKWEWL